MRIRDLAFIVAIRSAIQGLKATHLMRDVLPNTGHVGAMGVYSIRHRSQPKLRRLARGRL